MSLVEQLVEYKKKEISPKVSKIGIALAALGLLVVIFGYFADPTRSAFNNIVMLMFIASIGVGSLFLVALEYLAGAVWSTPFRRVSEILGFTLILLPIVAVPLFLNLHDVFHWTHIEDMMSDPLLKDKSGYLNTTFFLIRSVAYVLIWLVFYFLIIGNSRKQDETGDQSLTKKNIRFSAVFMPFFAITLTFSAIDWLMSLEPHWFSTIYGVYYFSGTVLAALAAATFIIIKLIENNYLIKGFTRDHYYSLGALMFAFTNFWAYIAFSQFLLIWYANLPEETFWFLQRWEGGWMYYTIGLIFVRFVIPYFGLLSQPSKMDPKRLKVMSLWILFAHFYDLYWLVMPTFGKGEFVFGWIEIGFPLLAVGLIILIFTVRSKTTNLIPIRDPKLKRGMDFRL